MEGFVAQHAVFSALSEKNGKTFRCDRKQKIQMVNFWACKQMFYLKPTQNILNSATILLDITFSHTFSLVH